MDPENTPAVPAENPEINALMNAMKEIGESLTSLNERVDGFEEKFTPKEEEPPVDPNNDPRKAAPADWGALRDEIEKTAESKAEERLRLKEEAETKAEEQRKTQMEELNQTFDQMADEAQKQGFLPEIIDENNPDDPGKEARRELFGYAAKLGSTNLVDVAENLAALHETGRRYDQRAQRIIQAEYRPAGVNVPVSSSANRSASTKPRISAEVMKRESLDTLAKMAMRQ